MSLSPARAREKSPMVSCRLDHVVTLQKEEDSVQWVIWAYRTMCCGSRGILPTWIRESSNCPGPDSCTLLRAGELFYPPDVAVWIPFADTKEWKGAKSGFILPGTCGCALTDDIRGHIEEQQRKWGIGGGSGE